jgi:hypothetical protein
MDKVVVCVSVCEREIEGRRERGKVNIHLGFLFNDRVMDLLDLEPIL